MSLPPKLSESLKNSKCEYRQLGSSGLRVSVPIFGCMSFGNKSFQPWVMDDDQALELLKAAYDRGVNTWDTANIYSNGDSEILIGKALKKFNIPRQKVVILTKCFYGIGEDPETRHFAHPAEFEASKDYQNLFGLSRSSIFYQVDESLRRLGTDYIDLLQLHRFDTRVPVEETVKALHDLVECGKVRYIGASTMWATHFARLQFCAEKNNWTRFISMQNHYNLLYREEERETIRFCNETGVGIIPWSPLCRGHLARPLQEYGNTERSRSEKDSLPDAVGTLEVDRLIIQRVEEIANKKGWPMSHVALAWLNKRVASPIVGFGSVERMEDAIAATGKVLTEEEERYLQEPYQPRAIVGHT